MKKPIFNINDWWDRYFISFCLNSLIIDENGWGQFYAKKKDIKPNKINIDPKGEFSDLDYY